MNNYRILNRFGLVFTLFAIAIISFGFLEGDKRGQQINHNQNVLAKTNASGKQGDAYILDVNNISWWKIRRKYLPLFRRIFPYRLRQW